MKWLIISLKSRKILNMMKDNAKLIKYGINKTKRNPLDEFICSECGVGSLVITLWAMITKKATIMK